MESEGEFPEQRDETLLGKEGGAQEDIIAKQIESDEDLAKKSNLTVG
jgi:hypothetical protein